MNSRRSFTIKRHHRIRAKISGTAEKPRLSIYRSNQGIYAQLIDDVKRVTLAGIRSESKNAAGATALGTEIAKKAKALKISTIVFDRGGSVYHGTIKALADAAREGGLKF